MAISCGVRPQVVIFAFDFHGKRCCSLMIKICPQQQDSQHHHTKHTQDALRHTHYVSRIAGPISSRCAKFRFQSLSRETMRAQLKTIAEKENVPLSADVCEKLLDCSGGDMRKAITSLQSVGNSTVTP